MKVLTGGDHAWGVLVVNEVAVLIPGLWLNRRWQGTGPAWLIGRGEAQPPGFPKKR